MDTGSLVFIWTGKIIWWLLCGFSVLAVLVIVIAVPIAIFYRLRTDLWKWILTARLAKEGFTQEDIVQLYKQKLPCSVDDFLGAVKRIKEASEKIRGKKNN